MDYTGAMEQLTRLRSLIAAGGDDSVFSKEDIRIIEQLHFEETGKPVRECGCRDRYTDAVICLYKSIKNRGAMAKEQQYMLRPGVIIWIGTEAYSRHNITDKIAKAYLKAFPGDYKKFERLPESYQTREMATLVGTDPETEK